VAVASSTSGDTWSKWRVAMRHTGFLLDKPSISMYKSTAVIAALSAANELSSRSIVMATSDNQDDPDPSWLPDPATNPPFGLNTTDLGNVTWNPIVKLRSESLGYIAYMHRADAFVSKDSYDVKVVRITRDPMVAPATWNATTILTLTGLQIASKIDGAVRDWRDWIPVSFDIGDGDLCEAGNCQEGGKHLYLAIRSRASPSDPTITTLWDCVDEDPVAGPCADQAGMPSPTWHHADFQPYNVGQKQYQPSVTTSKLPGDNTVALVWYEQSSGSTAIDLVGTYSTDGAGSWSPPKNLRGDGASWEPCPTKCFGTPDMCPADAARYYGDYYQSAILPLIYNDSPWIVTTFADSTTCEEDSSFDQHVQSIVW
jgi:hypothetical protein